LLRRASQDDAPAAPRQAPPAPRSAAQPTRKSASDPLNTLSADIAKALSDASAKNLWDRYQSGDRDVFSRSLYSADGQRTFDEIASKYRSDSTFKGSVDRYIADFERLIADVSKNDPDNVVLETYLVSDTGKVYTMLAHAAGRFG